MQKNIFLLISYLLVFFMTIDKVNSQEKQLIDKIGDEIEQIAEKGNFSGVVLCANNNEVVFHKAYGYANRAKKIKNNRLFKYNLGSINKLFTKIAIAKLVMDGKLNYDDRLNIYIPELRVKNVDKITILHLLTMTSGYGDYLGDIEFIENRKTYLELSDYLTLFKNKKLLFEPGSQRHYSNIGFELLGLVIERVSKMNYYEYVQKNIFNVANMPNTGYYTQDDNIRDLAVGYHKTRDGSITPNWDFKSYKGTAAGGGYSTLDDMLNLAKSLMNYEILDKGYLDLLCKKFKENSTKYDYLGVAGGGPGINAKFYMNRTSSEVVIVFANQDPPAANIVNDIFKKLTK